MELRGSASIFLGLLVGFGVVCSSEAYRFYVGGREGWVESPKEGYNQWAGRARFSVNDTLYFKYKEGDSVLLVSQDDYAKCSTSNPIKKWDGGSSEFTLDRSGPFFFIGGTEDRCRNGQRLIVTVLAVRSPPPSPSPLPPQGPGHIAPSPMSSPPQGPSPASPSPPLPPPTTAPPPSPVSSPPQAPSPAPPSPLLPPPPSPASPPQSAPSPTSAPPPVVTPPAQGPSPAAAPSTPPATPQSSPAHPPPVPAPTTPTPTPDHSPAPAPAPSSAWVMAPMRVWVLAGTLLFSGLIVC